MRVLALIAATWLCASAAHAQSEPLHRALDPYAAYQTQITSLLGAEINSAAALDDALERAARYDPDQLARGWIAYGALSAAQSPAFVQGVRARVRAAGRPAVLRQLQRDLTYARRRPPGAAQATQIVLAEVAADGARMAASAYRYEGIGAALDLSAWADTDRAHREQRLRAAPAAPRFAPEIAARIYPGVLSATPLTDVSAFGGARFWDDLAGRASPTPPTLPWRARADRAQSLERMLTLAALYVVDATAHETTRVTAVLDDPPTRECLELEQLELRQCASVAHDASEDAFCLARHGLQGPGACFASLAQATR